MYNMFYKIIDFKANGLLLCHDNSYQLSALLQRNQLPWLYRYRLFPVAYDLYFVCWLFGAHTVIILVNRIRCINIVFQIVLPDFYLFLNCIFLHCKIIICVDVVCSKVFHRCIYVDAKINCCIENIFQSSYINWIMVSECTALWNMANIIYEITIILLIGYLIELKSITKDVYCILLVDWYWKSH